MAIRTAILCLLACGAACGGAEETIGAAYEELDSPEGQAPADVDNDPQPQGCVRLVNRTGWLVAVYTKPAGEALWTRLGEIGSQGEGQLCEEDGSVMVYAHNTFGWWTASAEIPVGAASGWALTYPEGWQQLP